MLVGTNERAILQFNDQYFCVLTRRYIDEAEVARRVKYANDARINEATKR